MKIRIKNLIGSIIFIILWIFAQQINTYADNENSDMLVWMEIASPIDFAYEEEYLELSRWIQLSWNMPELSYVDWFYIYEHLWPVVKTYTVTWSDIRSFTIPWYVPDNTSYKFIIVSFIEYSLWTPTSICTDSNPECEIEFNTWESPDLSDYCSWSTALWVSKLPIEFNSTWEGKLIWSVNDAGQWKYITNIYDLWESNKNWTVTANFIAINSNSVNYDITWKSASMIDFVVHKKEMFNDESINQIENSYKWNQTSINVFIRDQQWRPVISWTQVKVKNLNDSSLTNLCTTDANWKCSWVYLIPSVNFNSSGVFSIKITADTAESDQYDFTINWKSSNLNINDLEAWVVLPDSELFNWTEFVVPVYIKAQSERIISYSFELNFDTNLFEPIIESWYPKVTVWNDVPWIPNTNLGQWKIIFSANSSSSLDSLSWSNLHTANIWMKVKPSANQWISWIFTAKLIKLENPSPRTINEDSSIVVKDLLYAWSMLDYSWEIKVRTVKESWFIASWWEYQLFNTYDLTNNYITTPITLISYFNNATNSWSIPSSCTSNNSSIADITWICTIRWKWIWDTFINVSKLVEWSNETKKVYINVFSPSNTNTYDIVFDNKLEYISEISSYQKSDLKLNTLFTDWNSDINVNTTDLVEISVEWWNFAYSNNEISRLSEWWWTIIVKQAWGAIELIQENMQSSNINDVIPINKLLVLLPKFITTSIDWWTSFLPWLWKKEINSKIESELTFEWDTLNSYLYLDLNDWNLQKIDPSLVNLYAYYWSWNSTLSWSNILTVDSLWSVVAQSSKWLWIVRAELKSTPSVRWDWYTCANLPDPVSLTVTPVINLAENANSPVVTHKWYQTSWAVNVSVNFSDWTSRNFSSDPRTSYQGLSWTWKYTLSDNIITSSDNWTTSWSQVQSTVDFWGWIILTWITTVNIIWVTWTNLESHEHYTPNWNSRIDNILNKIENSNTYQNTYLQAVESYSDWTNQTVTNFSDVYFFSNNLAVINFATPMKNFLTPQSVWTSLISVQSWLSTYSWTYIYKDEATIEVTNTKVDIDAFYLNFDWNPSYSLHWYKDQATKNVLWYVEFSDSARRYIVWNQIDRWWLISWLLSFGSSSWWVTTINSEGQMLLRWNWLSNITTQVVQDSWNTAPIWDWNIAWNLYPNVWDVDLWEPIWLPLNSETTSSWSNVTVKVRMNPWSYTLWSFTLEILYDETKMKYVSAEKQSGLSSSFVISPNWTAGTRSWLTILSIPWYEAWADESVVSPFNDIVNITFKSITNNLWWTWLWWEIIEIMWNDWTVQITKNEPIFAGYNEFINWTWLFTVYDWNNKSMFWKFFAYIKSIFWNNDLNNINQANIFATSYTWSQPKIWDINNTCDVTSWDARWIQLYLVNRISITEREAILWDWFPNQKWTWGIAWSDAIHINETISKIKHYLKWVVASRSWSTVKVRAFIIDAANQNPVRWTWISVQMETNPWAWWTGNLYTMTNNWTDKYYEYTITNAPSTWWIVIHLLDSNSTAPVTVAFEWSKIIDSWWIFKPIWSFDDEDTEWHFNTIYWKYIPTWCWNDTNFPPTEIFLTSNTFPENSQSWTIIWWISTSSYDNGIHTFEFAEPFWDNNKFTIQWNQIKLAQNLSSWNYKVRIRAIDNWSINWTNILWYEKQFYISSTWGITTKPNAISFNETINEEEVFTFDWSTFSWNYLSWTWWIWLEKIKIISLPTNWDLYYWWTISYSWWILINSWSTKVSSTWLEILYDDISNLHYAPNANVDTIDSFDWNWFNWYYYADADATVWFNINPLWDTPIVWTWYVYAYLQTQTWILIQKNPEDWSEVTHFRISNITNGTLFKSDWISQIFDWDYISLNEWILWVQFTSNSTENWYFDAESAHWVWLPSPQSAKARGTIFVLLTWDVFCWAPDSIQFENTVSSRVDNPVEYDFLNQWTWSYIWCEDQRWSEDYWWKLSMHISDLIQTWWIITSTIEAFPWIKIYEWSSSWVLTLSWTTHTMIETEVNNTEQLFGSWSINSIWALKVINIWAWTNVTGKYWIQPTVKVIIPAYQNLWAYEWTITLTLDKFIEF